MSILVVGGTGTIGKAVVEKLSKKHDLIIASRTRGDIQLNLEDPASIKTMYEKTGKIDALISCTGKVHFAPLTDFAIDDWNLGIHNKLMGQIYLVTLGIPWLKDEGSFTLTSGILNRSPVRTGAAAAMVNGGIDSFVKAATIDLPRGLRINAISPTILSESIDNYPDFFQGFEPVPTSRVALAYVKSVEGGQTGQVYCVE